MHGVVQMITLWFVVMLWGWGFATELFSCDCSGFPFRGTTKEDCSAVDFGPQSPIAHSDGE